VDKKNTKLYIILEYCCGGDLGKIIKKLLDFELSSNNGGWQWSASSGCDAAPYFRVFNPYEQTKKFDPQLKYIKHWIPGYDELNYIKPIIDHKFARERVLNTYKAALGAQQS
jgi:deoxyribodipyrimidine photo-lyase